MHEDQLLHAIAQRSADLARWPGVVIGPGDDAAGLAVPGGAAGRVLGANLLITTDQLIEGRHIEARNGQRPDDDWLDRAARKAIARSVSDIAAMAGRPLAAVATGALPIAEAWDNALANQLFERMKHWAEAFNCPLVGGDIATTPGPLLLTSTVLGTPHPARGPVLRSGAKPGDAVWVTGALGGSLGSGRHWSFTPRVEEAWALADALGDQLHAMMDLSDGLGIDGARLGCASRVCITIESNKLPRHPGVDAKGHWKQALGDGEDYELLFTVDASAADATIHAALSATGTPATRIGTVHEPDHSAHSLTILDAHGHPHAVDGLGWVHQ